MAGRQVFNSRIDAWLVAIFVADFLLVAFVMALVAAEGVDLPALLYLGGVVAFLGAMPAWLIASTHYTLGGDALHVRCGPFRWRVALADISSAEPSHELRSGPALSLHRVDIRYGQGKSLLISPADRDRFLSELRHAMKGARR